MKKVFLPLEKHLLFFISFVCLFLLSISGNAQISYSIVSSSSSIRMCGQAVNFTINATNNGNSTVTENVHLNLTYSSALSGSIVNQGLFISSPTSASAKVGFSGFLNNSSQLPISLSGIAPGENISITLTVRAGCNVEIGSSVNIIANSEIKNLSNATLSNLNFQILPNQNGTISPQFSSHPSWSQTSQKGQTLVRHFQYRNNTISSTFNGFLKFEDNLSGSVLIPSSIRVIFPGKDTLFIGTNSFIIPLTVLPGMEVRIEETVMVGNCINSNIDGTSSVTISTGCFGFDACNSINPTLFVTRDNNEPVISRNTSSVWDTYFKCFNESSYTERQISFTNSGSFANNIAITFVPPSDYMTDTSSFRIRISGGIRGTINGIYYRNPTDTISISDPLVYGTAVYGPFNTNNQNGNLSFYRDLIGPITGRSCNDNVHLWSRVIRKYIDSLGNIQDLNLRNGETLTLIWRDRSCCFQPNVSLRNQPFNFPAIRFFVETCEGEMKEYSGNFSHDYLAGFQTIDPFDPMIAGNPDKCIGTNDGQIREFTIRNVGITLSANNKGAIVLSNDRNNWGSYVMELSMEKGLDLDLSLNGTAVEETYNPACGLTICDASCNANLWDTTGERYRINFVHPTFGVWHGHVTKLPLSGSIEHKYKITFDIDSIPGNPQNAFELEKIFNEMHLEYSLRAYCGGGPQTNVFANLFYQPLCNTGCNIPLSKIDYHAVVTCPGCITPGGNIEQASFERHPDYLGFVDNNNDHIPDSPTQVSGILRTNCANGDLMVNTLRVFLSDGEKSRGGFILDDLPLGNEIDNLYIIYNIDNSILDFQGGLEASLDGLTWLPVSTPPISTLTGFTFQVNAVNDLGVTNFHHDSIVFFRCNFKVRSDVPQGDPFQTYIVYTPYFSDCDNCQGNFTDQAEKFSCDWSNGSIVNSCRYCTNTSGDSCIAFQQWQPNMGYFCQGGESLITIYPSPSAFHINSNIFGVAPCSPAIVYGLSVVSGGIDFPSEYRRWRFIEDGTNEFTFRQQIPSGYRVSRIDFNSTKNDFTNLNYYLDESDGPITGINGIQILGDTLFVTTTFTYQGFNTPYPTGGVPYTGAAFPITDDRLNLNLEVRLQPVNCATVSADSFNTVAYVDPASITPALILANPRVRFLPLPDINVPSLAGNPAGSYTVNLGSTAPHFNKPITNLLASTVTETNTLKRRYYVPVFFDNSAPLDGANNPLPGYNGNTLPSINAYNPFIYFTNTPYLDTVGIKIIGVYENEVNDATDLSAFTNFYDFLTNIARLTFRSGSTNLNYIPANTIQKIYTAVLEYTCPSGCDPFLSDCNLPDASYPLCVKEQKFLRMKYGWNCDGYPVDSSDILSTCNVKTIAPVLIRTPPVALNFQTSLSSNVVDLCEPFDYTLSLRSCLLGNISELFMGIELPDGVEYISNSMGLDTTMNGTLISFGDLLKDSISFNQFDSTIVIRLRATTLSNTGNRNIRLSMIGETYCGSPFTRGNFTPFDIEDVLGGLSLNMGDTAFYCTSVNSVTITPLKSGTFSFIGTTAYSLNADGSATFYPSQAGAGNYKVKYTLNDTCYAEYTIIVGELTVFAGNDTTLCAGSSVQIGSAPVSGLSYSWSPTVGLSNSTIANPVASPSVTTQYILTVSDVLNTCTDKDTVSVVISSPTPSAIISGTPTVCESGIGAYIYTKDPLKPHLVYSEIIPVGATVAGRFFAESANLLVLRLGSQSGGLRIVVRDSITGCSDTTNYFITVISTPIAFAGNDTTICSGQSLQLGTAPVAGNTYSWSPGSFMTNTAIANPIINPPNTFTYVLSVTNSSGCSARDTVVVNVVQFQGLFAGQDKSACLGSPVQIGSNPIPNYSYQWISGINISNRYMSNPTVNPNIVGSFPYVVQVTNAQGCSYRDTVIVTVQPFFITGPDTVCNTTSAFYSVQNDPSATYVWTVPAEAVIISGQGTSSINVSFGRRTGTITVTQSGGACSGNTASIPVFVDNSPRCCPDIYKVNANSTFTSDTIGRTGVMTTINAAAYGGTVIFDGVYYMAGNVRLTNGTFKMLPGTQIHVKSKSGMRYNFCNLLSDGNGSTSAGTDRTFLIADNATLEMNGAYLQAACQEEFWMGILGINGSVIRSDAGVVNGVRQNNVIRDGFYGIATLQNVCPGASDNRIYIDSTTFFNFRHIGVFESGKNNYLLGEGVQNSIFFSDPTLNKEICKNYSAYAIFIAPQNTQASSPIPDYNNLEIKNNTIHDVARGVLLRGRNAKVYQNRLYNVYRMGISYIGPGRVYKNNISIPSIEMNKFGIDKNDIVTGIETSPFIIHFPGYVVNVDSNNIYGDLANPVATKKRQVGIINTVTIDTRVAQDTISNLDEGIWFITNTQGLPAFPVITKNRMANNLTGVLVKDASYNSASNSPQIRCNDIVRNISFTGTTRGIWSEQKTFLSDLGTPTFPNGNRFSGITERMRNDGTNFGFDYFRYNSSDEDLGPIITGSATGNINTVSSSIANPVNACGGGLGVNSMKLSAMSIDEMMDDLRLKKGTAEELKEYQKEIIKFHAKNNKCSELEAYAGTLASKNPEAYNGISLYLAEHYKGLGNTAKSESIKDQLKLKSPKDKELEYNLKYMDITDRIWKNPGKAITSFSFEDSLTLEEIAKSEYSISVLACLQLRLFTEYSCNFTIKDKSKNKKEGILEDVDIAYLGEPVPNPAQNETVIGYYLPENTYQALIRVTDIVTGRFVTDNVLTEEMNGIVNLDLSNLKAGVYVCTLIVDGNRVDAKKIVVVK